MVAIIVLWILLGIIAVIVIALHFSVTAEISVDKKNVNLKITYLWFTVYPRPPKKPKKKRKKKTGKKHTDISEKSIDETLPESSQTDGPPEIPIEQLLEKEAEEVEPTEDDLSGSEAEEVKKDAQEVTEEIPKEDEKEPEEEKTTEDKKEEDTEHISSDRPAEEKTKAKEKKSKSKIDKVKDSWAKYKKYIPMGWKYFRKLLKTIRFTDTEIDLTVGKEDAYESALFYGKIQGLMFNLISVISGIFTVRIKKANVNCVFDKKTFDGAVRTKIRVRPSALIAVAFCMLVSFLKMYLPEVIKKRKARKKAKKEIEKKSVDKNETVEV